MKRILGIVVAMMVVGKSSAWALDLAGFGSYSSTTDIGDAWGLGANLDVGFGQSLFFGEVRASYYPEFTESIFDEELKISAFPLELGGASPTNTGHLADPAPGHFVSVVTDR